jgi:hypothetical protein
MRKLTLTLCAAAVALFASAGAYAQSDKAGEDKAAPSKPATKEEKAAAKKKRMATSKDIAHGQGSTYTDNTVKTGTKATAEEKAAGKAKRKAEGAEAAKNAPASAEGAAK